MKIDAPSQRLAVPDISRVKKGTKLAAVEQPQDQSEKVRLTDQVKILSNKAKAANTAELQAAQDAKVEAVKARVQAGNYQVGGRELAEKMLSRSARNKE